MSETALAYYVYCIAPADKLPALEGLAGVDPSYDVESIREGDLGAVVSRVRLQEFGSEALKHKLEDLAWLERTARAHEAVVARILAAGAVVPLRMFTIFVGELGVRDVLREEHESFLTALRRVRGHAEWSVKILADPRTLRAASREHSAALASADAHGAGHAYFARKTLERAGQDDARATIACAAEETHTRLREQATGATILPPQDPRLSGRAGEMVLNGAYLVERSRAARFAALVAELGARHHELGLTLELAGPFAPYNFVPSGSEPT
jgi:hypothetical protein